MVISRRDIIRNAALGAGVVAVGNVSSLFSGGAALAAPGRGGTGAYGELVPDPAGMLDLPPGFRYRIVSTVGEPLSGGGLLPDRFDGTGAFAGPGGSVRLVRNHEQGGSATYSTVTPADPAVVYDAGATGGTSTVVLDRHGVKTDEYVSIAGTYNNCAGGITPWGTWLTCEETEVRMGGQYLKDHGFVFEVDPNHPSNNLDPTPLTALGRFAHEAACIDPATGHVYLTEDASNPNGLIYRCVPNVPTAGYGSLRAGGTLDAMRCYDGGVVATDLSVYTEPGKELRVEWVRVGDPLAATVSTRKQFAYAGGTSSEAVTRSRKFEGAWWDAGKAFIVASFARPGDGSLGTHDGQVWSLDPAADTLTLDVRFEVNSDPAGSGADQPDGPDNITVSPWGGLLLCEDGNAVQHLLAVAPDGSTSLFARNHRDDSEFTGATFSPDRKTLFANIQQPGVTFAITGPFARVNRKQ
ncbi:MAG: alkaline phosphatase PhoX [Ilumatobacteraceae bacterium]